MSKFKVGDDVVCAAAGGNAWITQGKSYQVLDAGCDFIAIYNDFGQRFMYPETLFDLDTPKVSYPTPNPPHKYKDLIIAWANGAEIEFSSNHYDNWAKVGDSPAWNKDYQYRIKPSKSEKQLLKEELQAKAQELLDKIKELEDE